jgi:hypothetical protein
MNDINTQCCQNAEFLMLEQVLSLPLYLKKLSEQRGFGTKSTTKSHSHRKVTPILSTKCMEEKFVTYILSHFAGFSGMRLLHISECEHSLKLTGCTYKHILKTDTKAFFFFLFSPN